LEEFPQKASPHAHRILDLEIKACGGRLNIERLWTRLEGRMPYDTGHRADDELRYLLSKVKGRFLDKLKAAETGDGQHKEDLRLFAKHCSAKRIDCITFNYDDYLDRELWAVGAELVGSGFPYWGPDRGYGFPADASEACVNQTSRWSLGSHPNEIILLKLHGSLNWRIPLGHPRPYAVDAIKHHERWPGVDVGRYLFRPDQIEPYLEPDPFIVPPVLTKTALVEQPILRFLWGRAFEMLANSKRVVFLGYSLPTTDIAAASLFRESLQHLDPKRDVEVVDFARTPEAKSEKLAWLLPAYSNVFPSITPGQFDFGGALEWVRQNIKDA
jgi:hypothetical protein